MLNEAGPNLPDHLKPLGCRAKASSRVGCIPWGCSHGSPRPARPSVAASCLELLKRVVLSLTAHHFSTLRSTMKTSLFLFKRLFKFSAHTSFPHAINQCPPSAAQPFAHPRLSPAGRFCGSRVPDMSSCCLHEEGVGIEVANPALGHVFKSFYDTPLDKGGSVYSSRSTKLGGCLTGANFSGFILV